jgi:hypothetical protein
MKTQTIRKNQNNHFNSNTKNQKVMKTKKYSNSMKALTAVVFTFLFSAFLNAQFVAPAPGSNTNAVAEEVRATSTVSYDLSAGHTAGDTYRWVVVGGTIDDNGGALTVDTDGDSSIVEFTLDLESIDVLWDTDITGTPIGSAPGEIYVQKREGGTCASELQILDITMWNPATANLDLTGLVTELCSGESLGGNLPVNLTGAPDPVVGNFGFDVTYTVTATGGLTDLGLTPLNGTGTTIQDNDALAEIALPAGILNPTGADQTLTITLTAMNDNFVGPGTIGAITTYQITVHPTPDTGEINSSSSLTR